MANGVYKAWQERLRELAAQSAVNLEAARRYVEGMRGAPLTPEQDEALVELAEIVARGRDDEPRTSNYAYLTWERVKELAGILGVIPLKTVLYLESLSQEGWEGVK